MWRCRSPARSPHVVVLAVPGHRSDFRLPGQGVADGAAGGGVPDPEGAVGRARHDHVLIRGTAHRHCGDGPVMAGQQTADLAGGAEIEGSDRVGAADNDDYSSADGPGRHTSHLLHADVDAAEGWTRS
jgi:hypothetical protein